MSCYTIFWDNEEADVDLWASDDFDAMMRALEMAGSLGLRTFRLCRTGFDQIVIREVANVTDKVC